MKKFQIVLLATVLVSGTVFSIAQNVKHQAIPDTGKVSKVLPVDVPAPPPPPHVPAQVPDVKMVDIPALAAPPAPDMPPPPPPVEINENV